MRPLAYGAINSAFGSAEMLSVVVIGLILCWMTSVLSREFMFKYVMCRPNVSCDVRDTGRSLFELLCVRDGLFELDDWTLNNINEFIRLLSTV